MSATQIHSLRPRLTGAAASVLGVALCLGGCSGTRPPVLTVESVTLAQRTPEASLYQVTILAENPNDAPLLLRDVHFQLSDAQGGPTITGSRRAEASVRRFGAQRFSLPIVDPSGALRSPQDVRVAGSVSYQRPGAWAQTLADLGIRSSESFAQGASSPAPR